MRTHAYHLPTARRRAALLPALAAIVAALPAVILSGCSRSDTLAPANSETTLAVDESAASLDLAAAARIKHDRRQVLVRLAPGVNVGTINATLSISGIANDRGGDIMISAANGITTGEIDVTASSPTLIGTGGRVTLAPSDHTVRVAIARRRNSESFAQNFECPTRFLHERTVVDRVESRMASRMAAYFGALGGCACERVPIRERKIGNPRLRLPVPSIASSYAVGNHEHRRRQASVAKHRPGALGETRKGIIESQGQGIVLGSEDASERSHAYAVRGEEGHLIREGRGADADGRRRVLDRVPREDRFHSCPDAKRVR